MKLDRRNLLTGSALAGAAAAAATASKASGRRPRTHEQVITVSSAGTADMTRTLQHAIDRAAKRSLPVELGPGRFIISGKLALKPRTKLIGAHGLTILDLVGPGVVSVRGAADVSIVDIRFLGATSGRVSDEAALLEADDCTEMHLEGLTFDVAPVHGLKLWRCSGRVQNCRFQHIAYNAITSGNGRGLDISRNRIEHAGNNGIYVWRDVPGADHTIVANNHIAHIRTEAGGTGQNGNAINAFRADHVIISTNTIKDCAYSAVRCNAASNAQIIANNCASIGEVALYAEFAFEGAVIANNLVDGAATGIEVTNFQEGGRLVTVQGNLIRNLFRREQEPVDKRGIGIGVEAETVVNGNTIENAPTAGIVIGWGKWMRNVAATGNVIRNSTIGITVSALAKPGSVLLANNLVDGARKGAVRLADHNRIVGSPLMNGAVNAPAVIQGNLFT